jgi:two-component system, cell cycle response regulator DivK
MSTQILVVEDNEDLLDVFARQLHWMGFRVSVAKNGAAAVTMALSEHPELILMDISMPGMDGFEAVSQIKANPKTRDIPVLAVTGWMCSYSRQRFLASGFNGSIGKPFTHKELLCALEKLPKGNANGQSDAGSQPPRIRQPIEGAARFHNWQL